MDIQGSSLYFTDLAYRDEVRTLPFNTSPPQALLYISSSCPTPQNRTGATLRSHLVLWPSHHRQLCPHLVRHNHSPNKKQCWHRIQMYPHLQQIHPPLPPLLLHQQRCCYFFPRQ
ncbi:uncharacterized protein CIMG_10013 [Coccidioides immitis RS]|uniref:Uncharacterized protein n=1 Tax=Coccidioides immitis (strain RS) TaxID=246410 RepID=J3K0M4_COCIM|nr:uncharacterized protein CIMG_10013 [Coccidioides immitis RS]EAS27408.3 hypothetical protein CIMG_10013 [Coccidioides immitis RS]